MLYSVGVQVPPEVPNIKKGFYMIYRFPDTDIEVEFSISGDELKLDLLQRGELTVSILIDKRDLANAFKKVYFK